MASKYLVDQIGNASNIHLIPCAEIMEAKGEGHLQELIIRDINSEQAQTMPANALFIFIGSPTLTG